MIAIAYSSAKLLNKSLYENYQLSIAYYRLPDLDKALNYINNLIEAHPKEGYYHELKGQMLFENGRIAESITAYKRANDLYSNSPLIAMGLAMAHIAREEKGDLDQATKLLRQVVTKEPKNSTGWYQLGIALGRSKQLGESYLALAEHAALVNDTPKAMHFITLARKKLPEGSAAIVRLDDLNRWIKNQDKRK